MIKLVKGIIVFVIFLIFLVLIGFIMILFYSSDNEEIGFDKDKEYLGITNIIASDMNESIDNIFKSNYENNYLEYIISLDELNNYIVGEIRDNINENYLIEEDYIIKENGLALKSIMFVIQDNQLGLKVRLTAYGFYNTTLTMVGDTHIDEHTILNINFDNFVLGNNIRVSKEIVLDIFDIFSLDSQKIGELNYEDLTVSIDFEKFILEALTDEFIKELALACEYNLDVKEDCLILRANTSNLFDGGQKITYNESIDMSAVIANAINSANPNTKFTSITLTEPIINSLMNEVVNKCFDEFNRIIIIDDTIYNVRLKDFYYDFETDCILANLYINNLVSSVRFMMVSSVGTDKDSMVLKLSSVYIGKFNFVEIDLFFKEIIIDFDSIDERLDITNVYYYDSVKQLTLSATII